MLWEYIKNRMLKNLSKKFMEEKSSITYEEAVIFAESFGKKLDKPCCAILCRSELASALALLSCLAAGVTAVPLSFRYGDIHCQKIIKKICPNYLISDSNGELTITDIDCGGYMDDPEQRPALIMCTSGTTGSPKGIMLSGENLLCNLQGIEEYFDITEKDKILISRPIYHCAVLTGELLISLVKGLDIRFYSGAFNPAAVIKEITENKITVMCGTPTLFAMIAEICKRRQIFLPLKCIALSGECLGKNRAEKIKEVFPKTEIYHVYGLTEAAPRVAYLPPEEFYRFYEYVGRPLNGIEVKVVDEDGSVLPAGSVGELCIKGKNVMTGYYGDEERTKEVIKEGWLYTGDAAYINDRGFIKIKGRMDNMIIKAGMNIYPQEIENALLSDDRVEEVLAYSVPDEAGGEKIAVKIKGNFNDKAEVLRLCGQKLPGYECPAIVELVDVIEKNASGKMIRRKKYA